MVTNPTATDVRAIISTSLTDDQLDSLISDAALIAGDCILSLDEARQTAIIKWLAAHLIVSTAGSRGALTSKKMGDASESYAAPQLGSGLRSTVYGQRALDLDPNGCLGLSTRPIVMRVL